MISIVPVLIALIVSLGAVGAGSATQQPHPGHGIVLPTDTIVPHP